MSHYYCYGQVPVPFSSLIPESDMKDSGLRDYHSLEWLVLFWSVLLSFQFTPIFSSGWHLNITQQMWFFFLVFLYQNPKEKKKCEDIPDYTKHHFLSRPKVEEVTPHPSRTIASYLPSEVEVRPSITTTLSNRPIHKPSTLPSVDVIDLVKNRRRWHMWI